MFSVILYILRQTFRSRASPLPSVYPSYCDVSQARSHFASTISGGTFPLSIVPKPPSGATLLPRLVTKKTDEVAAWIYINRETLTDYHEFY
jgi:hypothetical protein